MCLLQTCEVPSADNIILTTASSMFKLLSRAWKSCLFVCQLYLIVSTQQSRAEHSTADHGHCCEPVSASLFQQLLAFPYSCANQSSLWRTELPEYVHSALVSASPSTHEPTNPSCICCNNIQRLTCLRAPSVLDLGPAICC